MGETQIIRVRYWAAAKAAAGTAEDVLHVAGPVSLAEVMRRSADLHPDGTLERVLGACSTLIGEAPAGTQPPEELLVEPGATVEFLPPFAGG
ncbi:MoaD/ThiS family protein [Nocardioides sp.]|uniref:MoaD/ThiS family protein n=1 Tax=Nocardioides sp. TaxID=35761 RepID=UPI003561410E